ncbi:MULTISPECIES: site-specific integrase [Actinomycetes]|uniref:tyrosine-type recombinase/integrase n=1 Tax=Actinomycetes TaxID=1760 RepID=UPI00131A219C|nr:MULTISPECIES: site-specific integrase [Actinomycetes]
MLSDIEEAGRPMAAGTLLTAVADPSADGVPTADALASFLRHLANRRGRSGRITSPETVRSYTTALPRAFAGIAGLGELDGGGRDRLHANIRTAWGDKAPSTFNARRAAVASALAYFDEQEWIEDAAAVLAGLDREHQPKPDDTRVRDREQIDRLVADKRRSLEDRTLWSMLYSTAARAEEVLALDIEDLDRANRRARTIRKGGKADDLLYDVRTARMLGQLLGRRTTGPIFLSARRAPDDGTVPARDVDPVSRRRRMTYRTAERRLGAATGGWDLHDLRHSRLTHAGEDGATEADLMNLSGHEDRRTLQRYLKPSKEGTHRRLDDIDARRSTRPPSADELAARMAYPPTPTRKGTA